MVFVFNISESTSYNVAYYNTTKLIQNENQD